MKNLLNLRRIIALFFVAFLGYVGIKFYYFVRFYETGQGYIIKRPPSVEGFLPISALMAFRQLIELQIWDYIHPAGLTIFIAILLTAFFFRRFFCSFICPIGTLSDWLHVAGQKIFRQTLQPPKWLNTLLGSLKFILLGFFAYAVFIMMDITAVSQFLSAPYNKIADVKMLHFFLNISQTGLLVIIVLAAASLFIPYFWCRYLCPYGALLAIISKFSPAKITRNADACIDCKKCDKACPSAINISTKGDVSDSSCISCFSCVDACPKAGTLQMQFFKRELNIKKFAIISLGMFFLIILWAMLTGHWETNIAAYEWKNLIPMSRIFNH